MERKFYELHVAGLTRYLPICALNEHLSIAGFVIFGDPELTVACARELNAIAPEHDIILTAESKGIPLAHEMARQAGEARYVLARKSVKAYMTNVFSSSVDSITTDHRQTLSLSDTDVDLIRGKRVLIVDDVISTGASLEGLEKLVRDIGGNIVGRMAILAEGDAIPRKDIAYLAPLPLFDGEGNPL